MAEVLHSISAPMYKVFFPFLFLLPIMAPAMPLECVWYMGEPWRWGLTEPSIDYIRKNVRPLNVSQVISEGPGQVVYIGEFHGDYESKEALTKNMQAFHDKGFAYLGLEMIETKKQDLVDAYVPGQENEALRTYLKEHWGYDTNAYMELIDSAKRAGIRVVGIDNRDKDLIGKTMYLGLKASLADEPMARAIAGVLGNDKSKRMLALTGLLHAIQNRGSQFMGQSSPISADWRLGLTQPQTLKKNYGITSQTYLIEGSDRLNKPQNAIREDLRILGIDPTQVYIPIPEGESVNGIMFYRDRYF
jgi:hypothetical protein